MYWCRFGLGLLGLAGLARALDPVEVKGNKFFNKDGSQFFIKGVAYQLRPEDPLVDTDQCNRDIALMKDLGVNTLRVYHVDETAKHDGCMNAFADAGIYLLIDLDTFDTYIIPPNQCWSTRQYDRFSSVMDTFQAYPNVLGFFIGNENIARKEDSAGAPFLKAAARDMKAYRDKKGYRKIPIGYSAADIKELRPMLQEYLTCGGNASETIEFFGINSYSWCDPSTYEESTYNQLQEQAKNFPVPIFFTETGCNVPGPRLWHDQDAIFGPQMVGDWSGAVVYEWIQEQNNYGMISYGPPVGDPTRNDETVFDNWSRKGTPTPVTPDYSNLKEKWASIKPTGVKRDDYDPSHVSTRPCPSSTEGGWWQVPGNVRLPALGETMTSLAASPGLVKGVSNNGGSPADGTGGLTSFPSATEAANEGGGQSSMSACRRAVILALTMVVTLVQLLS
ncbi:unnamed protein product [Clonostachys rosea f. rosea IK726]|uniref:1,3-beta-glucanosyltransferase n=2 Tax=Bionectria ochroleuca TaxID=29856 RepID=A0A0B7JLQ2_BIOOC|nr:unnamed protein product [Clonostachys rosea f. rosea IK726]